MSGTRVAALLEAARSAGLDRLDAQLLLAAVLGRPRTWLLAHDDVCLPAEAETRWRALLGRRAAGEPLAYLLGEKEFHGLALRGLSGGAGAAPRYRDPGRMGAGTLPTDTAATVVDLGTGSGAIALALASSRPLARVTAVDASESALAVARRNGQRHGLAVRWLVGDWFDGLTGERFGLIVSNPPYIAEGDPHLAALQHEPIQALTSGADGLDALRHIVAAAPVHLEPGGWLLLEHGHDQAEAVCALLARAGLSDPRTRRDLAGLPRCSGAQMPGTPA